MARSFKFGNSEIRDFVLLHTGFCMKRWEKLKSSKFKIVKDLIMVISLHQPHNLLIKI